MLKIKDKNIIHIIDPNDIIFCQSKGNYTFLILRDKKVLTYQSLKNLASVLYNFNSSLFFRCHNSFVVNIACILEIDIKSNKLHLDNGEVLPISKSKKKKLEIALEIFLRRNPD